jgi:hypothetical protein
MRKKGEALSNNISIPIKSQTNLQKKKTEK